MSHASRRKAPPHDFALPGTTVSSVDETLIKVISGPTAEVKMVPPPLPAPPPSPVRKDVMDAVARVVHQRYPNGKVLPGMSDASSDSVRFRAAGVPSYGVSGMFVKPGDTLRTASTRSCREAKWRPPWNSGIPC